MSQYVETACRTFLAAAIRAVYLRVYSNSGTLTTAGASNPSIGTQEVASLAATDYVPVRLRTAQGTRKGIANAPIAAGAHVYAGAAGKYAASGTIVEGIAMEAAGADGDVFEIMDIPNTDIATAITGTTSAVFEVDSDAATPKIALAGQTAGSGDFTTTLKPEAALSGDNVMLVPEADGDTLAAVALAQTLSNKTLAAPIITGLERSSYTTTPVAAVGSTVADAGQLPSTNVCHITSDGATKGVKLPTGAAGMNVFVINNSGTAAELYAASGGTINGGSPDASVVVPASKGVWCHCTAADTWIAFDLAAKASAS
jgi:hypothetical protein